MADVIAGRAPRQNPADSLDFDDAEIDALLAEAETRMRESASAISKIEEPSKHSNPKLETSKTIKSYIHNDAGGTASLTEAARKALPSSAHRPQGPSSKPTELPFMRVDDPVKIDQANKEKKDKTAGPAWYNMPATELTPQIKRDLQMIKLRNVLDPHKHFKGDDWKGKLPKYFQMGTLIEGPTEYYSARLNNKDRQKSMVDEVLANRGSKDRFKRKYAEIQAKKRSGRKEFYKKLKEKRRKGRK
ncbi:hypothetical protein Dda_0959 [Drechslerella dactyloides]|uniref:Fcf2 pre-rRNA processing C-terminal domain-containing protein n=1 Tax=Drechslerella dactyloides TaxID=74499 RepID=A0AAD6J8E5_DREDA|nr:hypothetical protein Dda_0959 [Drechslerella dactyloides]